MTWNGEELKRRIFEASKAGIDITMSEAVIQAKRNHPGWGPGFTPKFPRREPLTGVAEGSVRIQEFARQTGAFVSGLWGSSGVNYVKWLEIKHGSFLRNAADVKYRNLTGNIRRKLGGVG